MKIINHDTYKPNPRCWFALFPVKTDDGWIWLRFVNKFVDERPEQYQGLLPTVWYKKIKQN